MSSREDRKAGARRRGKKERRGGRDRRRSADIHDLYQTDLDRHLWSFRKGKAGKGGKPKKSVRRKVARLVAGAVGVAGLTYWLYRRRRGDEVGADDLEGAQAEEAVEAEDQEEEPAGV